MKEQRISTALEASGDRTIAIRMYGMETVSDTTWDATSGPDAARRRHRPKAEGASRINIRPYSHRPQTEVTGRGGSYTLSCP